MPNYYISGVWKDANGTITDYAMHLAKADDTFTAKATKVSKTDAIVLVETKGNMVSTLTWNYSTVKWRLGETVSVVKDGADKYLRTAPDNKLSDNLGHLICWNCFI